MQPAILIAVTDSTVRQIAGDVVVEKNIHQHVCGFRCYFPWRWEGVVDGMRYHHPKYFYIIPQCIDYECICDLFDFLPSYLTSVYLVRLMLDSPHPGRR